MIVNIMESLIHTIDMIDITELKINSIDDANNNKLNDYIDTCIKIATECAKELDYNRAYKYIMNALSVSFEHPKASKMLTEYTLHICLGIQQNFNKCLELLRIAEMYDPCNPILHYNIGLLLFKTNSLDSAVIHFKTGVALSIQSRDMETLYLNYMGMANVYSTAKCWSEAVYFLKKASAIKLDPECLSMLALGYTECRRGDLSENVYIQAISLCKNTHQLSSVYMNYGHLFAYNGDNEHAIQCYTKSLEYNNDNTLAFQNKLLSMCYSYSGDAMQLFLQHIKINKFLKNDIRRIKHTKELLFFDDIITTQYNKKCCRGEKLNIGFVSGDFKNHPVSFFLENLMTRYNKTKFAFYCYSQVCISPDWVNNVEFRIIHNEYTDTVVNKIRSDNIDILIDLSGHTAFNRLDVFARKPADIQMTYCGYPYTTGLTTIDYRITDTVCDNENSQDIYIEKLLFTKGCFLNYYTNMRNISQESPYLTSKKKRLTLCCFNRLNKISNICLDMYISILTLYPKVVIVFKTKGFNDSSVSKKFISRFPENIRNRIIIKKCNISHDSHLQEYNNVDFSLDTYPYSGTTTSCESLSMGVPVITLRGDIHFSNVTSSLLYYSGLYEYAVNTQDDYIKLISNLLSRPDTFYRNIKKNTSDAFNKMCSNTNNGLSIFMC